MCGAWSRVLADETVGRLALVGGDGGQGSASSMRPGLSSRAQIPSSRLAACGSKPAVQPAAPCTRLLSGAPQAAGGQERGAECSCLLGIKSNQMHIGQRGGLVVAPELMLLMVLLQLPCQLPRWCRGYSAVQLPWALLKVCQAPAFAAARAVSVG